MPQTEVRTDHPFAALCCTNEEVCFEWLTSTFLKPQDHNHFAHITTEPDVYICDWRSATDQDLLSQYKIGYVLSLREVYGEQTSGSENVFSEYGIIRVKCFFEDNGSSQDQMIREAYDHLKRLYENAYKSERALLIHCEAGCSRSPSLFAAFLCLNYRQSLPTFRSAVEFISRYRNLSIDAGLARNICRIFEIDIE